MIKILFVSCASMMIACGAAGAGSADGEDGSGCTVDGDRLECDDGTSWDLVGEDGADGERGEPGETGATGAAGEQGAPGEDGASCSVRDTDSGAVITCDDGTTATINDGAAGTAGEDGADGLQGLPGAGSASSGGRIKAITLSGDDGSEAPSAVFFDSTFGVLCSPGRHTDGSIRCLPLYQASATGLYYGDSECSTEYASYGYQGSGPPKFAVRTEIETGLSGADLLYPTATRVYWATDYVEGTFRVGPTCEATIELIGGGLGLYEMGAEVESGAFVEFTVEGIE